MKAISTRQRPHDDLALQRRTKIERALRKLDPTHRTVLVMKFFGRLSTKQIAVVLCCSVSSVQVLQQQALVELQHLIS